MKIRKNVFFFFFHVEFFLASVSSNSYLPLCCIILENLKNTILNPYVRPEKGRL